MCLQDMNAFHCSVCFLNKPKYTVSETDGLCLVCLERQSRITNGLKPEEKVPDADEVVRYVAFSKNARKVVDVKAIVDKSYMDESNIQKLIAKFVNNCDEKSNDEEEKHENVFKLEEYRVEFEEYQKLIAGCSESDDENSNQTFKDASDDETPWHLDFGSDSGTSFLDDYFK
jgi:hypothetical protein